MASDPDTLLLAAWDAASGAPAWVRAGVLLDELAPEPDGAAAADQPLGTLTRRFLDLAATWFGDELATVTECQSCGAALDAVVSVDELRRAIEATAASARSDDLDVRPLTLTDLAAAAGAPDHAAAGTILARRALVGFDRATEPDAELVAAVSAALDAVDPLATLTVRLTCPTCGEASEPVLDLGACCWTLADARVRRLLDEVHELAAAYGWSEADIVALGPHRRAHYLTRVRP